MWCSEYEMKRHREQLAQWARHVALARCQALVSICHDPLLPASQSPTSSTVGPQKPSAVATAAVATKSKKQAPANRMRPI